MSASVVVVKGDEEAGENAGGGGGGCPEEEALRARVGDLEREVGDFRGQLDAANNECANKENNLVENVRQLEGTVNELRGNAEHCQGELAAVSRERDELRASLEQKDREQQEVQRKLDSASNDHSAEIEKVKGQMRATAEQLKTTHDDLLKVKHDLHEKEARLKEIENSPIFKVYEKVTKIYKQIVGKFQGGGGDEF